MDWNWFGFEKAMEQAGQAAYMSFGRGVEELKVLQRESMERRSICLFICERPSASTPMTFLALSLSLPLSLHALLLILMSAQTGHPRQNQPDGKVSAKCIGRVVRSLHKDQVASNGDVKGAVLHNIAMTRKGSNAGQKVGTCTGISSEDASTCQIVCLYALTSEALDDLCSRSLGEV